MIVSVRAPEYFPHADFFALMLHSEAMICADTFQFSRQSRQNRARIRTPEGAQWLTLPVRYHFGDAISALRFDETASDWRRQHFKSLQNNYQNSAFFEYYAADFETFYQAPYEKPADVAMASIRLVHRLLGLTQPIFQASTWLNQPKHLPHLYETAQASAIVTLPDATHFHQDLSLPTSVLAFELPAYRQVFKGYVPALSILDLLFNYGPESLMYLRSGRLSMLTVQAI